MCPCWQNRMLLGLAGEVGYRTALQILLRSGLGSQLARPSLLRAAARHALLQTSNALPTLPACLSATSSAACGGRVRGQITGVQEELTFCRVAETSEDLLPGRMRRMAASNAVVAACTASADLPASSPASWCTRKGTGKGE